MENVKKGRKQKSAKSIWDAAKEQLQNQTAWCWRMHNSISITIVNCWMNYIIIIAAVASIFSRRIFELVNASEVDDADTAVACCCGLSTHTHTAHEELNKWHFLNIINMQIIQLFLYPECSIHLPTISFVSLVVVSVDHWISHYLSILSFSPTSRSTDAFQAETNGFSRRWNGISCIIMNDEGSIDWVPTSWTNCSTIFNQK